MQVRKQQLELDMKQRTGSKLGKEYIKAAFSPCLFNLYAECIMQNAGLDEAQVGIKIAGRDFNNFRYADNTNLRAECEEELKSLLMNMKEWKSWFKTQHSENKDYGIQAYLFMAKNEETMETMTDYFLGLQNHCRWWQQPWN